MDANLLVDAIVRQTTVLIGQLTAVKGPRTPLAHLADEVLLNLSDELHRQGLSQKVVADMFGMALRSYQRKVQRVRQDSNDPTRMLWHQVLEYVQKEQQLTKIEILDKFGRTDPNALMAVLKDLVECGLVSSSGSGPNRIYLATPPEAQRLFARRGSEETARAMVWIDVCHNPGTSVDETAARVYLEREHVEAALQQLVADGQVSVTSDKFEAIEAVTIREDSEEGWEAAVFDHFQSVVGVIMSRIAQMETGQSRSDVGASTFSFDLSAEHPLEQRVRGFLGRVRDEANALWEEVEKENEANPIEEEERQRVVFYVGQLVKEETE